MAEGSLMTRNSPAMPRSASAFACACTSSSTCAPIASSSLRLPCAVAQACTASKGKSPSTSMPETPACASCARRKPSCTTSLREGGSLPERNFGYRSATVSCDHSTSTRVGLKPASACPTLASCACCSGASTSGTVWLCRSWPGFDMWNMPSTITWTGAAARTIATSAGLNMPARTAEPWLYFTIPPDEAVTRLEPRYCSPGWKFPILGLPEHDKLFAKLSCRHRVAHQVEGSDIQGARSHVVKTMYLSLFSTSAR